MFRILAQSLAGSATEKDPFAAEPASGFPLVAFERCTACDACSAACPTGALRLEGTHDARRVLTVSHAACTQCGECFEACPGQAITPGPALAAAVTTRLQLTRRAAFVVDAVTGRGRLDQVEEPAGPTLEEAGARLRERVRKVLGRSLHVRQVDAGGCNGCEVEIAATANPVYDLERFGIHFVASPRHADLLLVSGVVTRNMEVALRRAWEAAPEPRLVVAAGACACTGGIFGEGTYACVGGVERVLPVDVYVPGCPPTPRAILEGLFLAMGRRPS